MNKKVDVRVGDIWKDGTYDEHFLVFDKEKEAGEDLFWIVCIEDDTFQIGRGAKVDPVSFKNDTLVYREPSIEETWKDLGDKMKAAFPSQPEHITSEQVENMTLKELGLVVKGRENSTFGDVAVYIEAPNNPDVNFNLKHTTLKGATITVTESFKV